MTLNWPLPVGLPQYRVLSRSVKATLSHDTAHWAGIKWNPWLNRRKKGRPAAYIYGGQKKTGQSGGSWRHQRTKKSTSPGKKSDS